MTDITTFSHTPAPSIAEAGGKGFSLIRMYQAGLGIPPGAVLNVSFFRSWFASLRSTSAWESFTGATSNAARVEACAALKAEALLLRFSPQQRSLVEATMRDFDSSALFAVRSSSPEEDLVGSSFAGGYETVLGVTHAGIELAVRCAFASCLDERIVIYKQAHGFDPLNPSIAVVIQLQIASEIAGVGFSLNPISNDSDEAVFSSNWGLGESVVAGLASPDLFIVDKVGEVVVDRQIGAKETALWLLPSGGTEERPDPRTDVLTLSDAQVLELTEELRKVDALYNKPMDIEWAFAAGRLYLLQARPITTQVPLHPDLITPPGARRRAYFDITISVQGILKPLSVFGGSILKHAVSVTAKELFRRDITESIEGTIPLVRDGRIYLNLSNLMCVADQASLASFFEKFDSLAAGAIRELDASKYRALSFSRRDKALGVLQRAPKIAFSMAKSRFQPQKTRAQLDAHLVEWFEKIDAISQGEGSLTEISTRVFVLTTDLIFDRLLPALVTSQRAMGALTRHFEDSPQGADQDLLDHVEALGHSLPGNVTLEMGLALYELSQAPDFAKPLQERPTLEGLKRFLENGEGLSEVFVKGWEGLMRRYGHRGITELDIAQPRFRDAPDMLLQQILQMVDLDPDDSPRGMYDRAQAKRKSSVEALDAALAKSGWFAHKKYRGLIACVEHLGGHRETHKFCMIFALDKLRTLTLKTAAGFVSAGRLDRAEDIFDLTLEDIEAAILSAQLDLRAVAKKNRAPLDRLALVPELPRIIDSRGRIFRAPPPEAKEGELAGQPISAGVYRGVVKVLHTPDEKPLHKGEILVARATDPGWTPLFVNAGAIILEVGGLLQHGALVAREYGKPCVAGIAGVLQQLQDGDIVEVDGAAGVVRLISSSTPKTHP